MHDETRKNLENASLEKVYDLFCFFWVCVRDALSSSAGAHFWFAFGQSFKKINSLSYY